jgi:uncharacterized membrane protein
LRVLSLFLRYFWRLLAPHGTALELPMIAGCFGTTRPNIINAFCTLYGTRRFVIKSDRMKRTLTAVAAAVLMSMMALMFLGGLLKKAARVVDGLNNGSR